MLHAALSDRQLTAPEEGGSAGAGGTHVPLDWARVTPPVPDGCSSPLACPHKQQFTPAVRGLLLCLAVPASVRCCYQLTHISTLHPRSRTSPGRQSCLSTPCTVHSAITFPAACSSPGTAIPHLLVLHCSSEFCDLCFALPPAPYPDCLEMHRGGKAYKCHSPKKYFNLRMSGN